MGRRADLSRRAEDANLLRRGGVTCQEQLHLSRKCGERFARELVRPGGGARADGVGGSDVRVAGCAEFAISAGHYVRAAGRAKYQLRATGAGSDYAGEARAQRGTT